MVYRCVYDLVIDCCLGVEPGRPGFSFGYDKESAIGLCFAKLVEREYRPKFWHACRPAKAYQLDTPFYLVIPHLGGLGLAAKKINE